MDKIAEVIANDGVSLVKYVVNYLGIARPVFHDLMYYGTCIYIARLIVTVLFKVFMEAIKHCEDEQDLKEANESLRVCAKEIRDLQWTIRCKEEDIRSLVARNEIATQRLYEATEKK
jgi:hypothetical protein